MVEQEPKQKSERKTANERYIQYMDNKTKVLDLERKNKDKLYVVKTHKPGDEWYKMFGHSAIIYAFDLCPRLKRAVPKIHPDKDPQYGSIKTTARTGVVIVKSLKALKADMDRIGVKIVYNKDGLTEFKLEETYSLERLKELQNVEEQRWAEANKMVLPDIVMPALYSAIRATETEIFRMTCRMKPNEMTLVGDDMLLTVSNIMREYVKMANGWDGKMHPEKFIAFARESTYRLRADVAIVMNERIVDASVVYRIEKKLETLELKITNAKY